jgi:hypothetical protein
MDLNKSGYRFDTFPELATADGFNYPVDVYFGTLYLGTLTARPNGFVIHQFDSPTGKKSVVQSPTNLFRSKNIAASALHHTWKHYRHGDGGAVHDMDI